jgi:hypothetical protein
MYSQFLNQDAANAEWTYRQERFSTRRAGRTRVPGQRRFTRGRRG